MKWILWARNTYNLIIGHYDLEYESEARRRALTAVNFLVVVLSIINRVIRTLFDTKRIPLLTPLQYYTFTVIFAVIYLILRYKYIESIKYLSIITIYSFFILLIYLSPEQFYGFFLILPMSVSFFMLSNKENSIISLIATIVVLQIVKDKGGFDGFMAQFTTLIGVLLLYIIQKQFQSDIQEHNLQQLDRNKEQMFRANKMKLINKMSGGVFHDLNNYHMIVTSNLEMLLLTTDQTTKLYKDLEQILDTMKKSNLLLGKIRMANTTKISKFTVSQLFEEVTTLLTPIIDRDIMFTVNLSKELESYKMYGPANQLTQVLLNMITNAQDAIREKKGDGKITLSATATDTTLLIKIADNGIGITRDQLTEIFEPFVSTKKHGTGIGLVIAKEIIENSFKGKIEVQSTVNIGTEFTLLLPIV